MGFNGKELEEAEEYNMNEMDWRHYDPAIARWVCTDPVIHHSASPYSAFDNNPVYWSDPSGLISISFGDYNWNTGKYKSGSVGAALANIGIDYDSMGNGSESFEFVSQDMDYSEFESTGGGGGDDPTPRFNLKEFIKSILSWGKNPKEAERNNENRRIFFEATDKTIEFGTEVHLLGLDIATLPFGGPGKLQGANLARRELQHIIARHWYTSTAQASKFAKGTTITSLHKMIETTTIHGAFRPNTLGRPVTIAEYNFGKVIGTTTSGKSAYNLRVIIGTNGNIITAFPF